MSTTAAVPLYFEISWSILSTIGLINVLYGFMVVGITGFSPIILVPVVVSGAGAIANGMCYYALYANYNTKATVVAAVFADLFWLIQEAGLSFYSYMILNRVLKSRARTTFLSSFWFIIFLISAIRMAILVCRAKETLDDNNALQNIVSRLHIGYFVLIAVVEILSAFFLLKVFAQARKRSVEVVGRVGLFTYLTQSTELRLATLALIGVSRAITYSFQKASKAQDVTGQVDRFIYTLECMFPIIFYIDILASRIARTGNVYPTSSQNAASKYLQRSRHDKDTPIGLYSMHGTKTATVISTVPISSSQERIVGVEGDQTESRVTKSPAGTLDYEREERERDRTRDSGRGGKTTPTMALGSISKTVEFGIQESHAR